MLQLVGVPFKRILELLSNLIVNVTLSYIYHDRNMKKQFFFACLENEKR